MSDEVKNRFIEHGIPFDDIDPEMVNLLEIFNFQFGLKTKYCCYGHLPYEMSYIVFDESVKDEDIYKLAQFTAPYINYNKWVRYSPIMTNWTCQIGAMYENPDHEMKLKQLNFIEGQLRKIKVNRR